MDKFGRPTQVKRSILKQIEDLETITSTNRLSEVHTFTEKLSKAVRTLRTMGSFHEAQALVYPLFDKLGSIKEYIIQRDDDWFNWNLSHLVNALEKYCDRNPVTEDIKKDSRSSYKNDRGTNRDGWKGHRKEHGLKSTEDTKSKSKFNHKCVYCEDSHPSYQCTTVLDVASRSCSDSIRSL